MISGITESKKRQPLYRLVDCIRWFWSCLFCIYLYIFYITWCIGIKQSSKRYERLVLGAWQEPRLACQSHSRALVTKRHTRAHDRKGRCRVSLSQTTCTLVTRVVKPDGDEPSKNPEGFLKETSYRMKRSTLRPPFVLDT